MIIWKKKAQYSQKQLIEYLKKNLIGRVQSVFLFGSYAQDKANSESDIDIIIVCETQREWPERHRDFANMIQQLGPVDCLIYTPEEWGNMLAEPSPFIKHISQHWLQVV